MLYTEESIKKRNRNMNTFKKIVTIIAYSLVIPLLIYNISLMIQAVITPNKTPSFFGVKAYTIISGSMEPEIQIGDIVLVKETQKEDLQVGDVISFRQGQSVITHRIIEIQETEGVISYKTKGDNNNVEDEKSVDYSQIEGKAIGRIPFLGKISTLLQGKITVIVIALISYIYYSHTSSVSRKKNRRKVKRMKYEENNKGE